MGVVRFGISALRAGQRAFGNEGGEEEIPVKKVRYLIGDKPLSFYLMYAATAIGVAGTVSAFVLQMWPFAIVGLLLTSAVAFTTYQIKKLSQAQALGALVDALNRQVQLVTRENVILKGQLNRLDGAGGQLNEQLENIQESFAQNHELLKTAEQMSGIAASMRINEEQQQQMRNTTRLVLSYLQQLSSQLCFMGSQSAQVDERVQSLQDRIDSLQTQLNSLEAYEGSFKESMQLYETLNEAVAQIFTQISEQVVQFQEVKEQIRCLGEIFGHKANNLLEIIVDAKTLLKTFQREKQEAAASVADSRGRSRLIDEILLEEKE